MICPKCQTNNPETVRFCGDCGTAIPAVTAARPSLAETMMAPAGELTTGSTFADRWIAVDPIWEGLRSDPKFREITDRIQARIEAMRKRVQDAGLDR